MSDDQIKTTDDNEIKETETESTDTSVANEEVAQLSSENVDAEGEPEFEFVEAPIYDIQYKGECAYEVGITIPAVNENKRMEELFAEVGKDVELPGFRRGRAPRKLVEKKLGKYVKGEAESSILSAAFQKLVKDNSYNLIGQPEFDGLEALKERKEDEPITFTAKFEVSPKVELGKYRGIDVERPIVTVKDSDVENTIDEMRSRQAAYETITEKAEKDDQVYMDFVGTIDGVEFPGGKADNYPYVLGSKYFFPEFEEALVGASANETRTCEVTFPEDYRNDQVKGKTAQFTITVKEVKRLNKPELTDEFATEAGYESLEDMKAKVKAQLETNASEQSTQIAQARALEAIVNASTFEIPQTLIKAVEKEELDKELRRLRTQRVPESEIEERMEEIKSDISKAIVTEIKGELIVSEIAEAEGLELTEEDFERESERISAATGIDLARVSEYMGERSARTTAANRIIREKALAVVLMNANITEKELTDDAADAEK